MVRMRNLEVPLAPPKASLSEGKCSRKFVRLHVALMAGLAENKCSHKFVFARTHRWKPVCQKANSLP